VVVWTLVGVTVVPLVTAVETNGVVVAGGVVPVVVVVILTHAVIPTVT
jgi:hypothetical protein